MILCTIEPLVCHFAAASVYLHDVGNVQVDITHLTA
jgi:hypothetical protein